MSYEQIKPLLIDYLIKMTGCAITPNQIATNIGVTNKTASHYLYKLVESDEIDCIQRISLPDKKVLSYGYMYYVNNLSLIKNTDILRQTQDYQRLKKMYGRDKIYYAVIIKYTHPNGITKKHTINVGLFKTQ
jgi:hypothetical protein